MRHTVANTFNHSKTAWISLQYILLLLAGLSFFVAYVVHSGAVAYAALGIGLLAGLTDIYIDIHVHCEHSYEL